MKRSPAGAPQAFQAATALHERGMLDDAAQLYQAALAQDRHHFQSLHYLGVLRVQQGKAEEGAALIRKALRQDPQSAEAHNNLGVALEALRRHEAAVASYRKALAITPDYVDAHNNLGNALQSLGRFGEAVASYEAALAMRPDYATAHYNLGISLQALARQADAIEHYRRAIMLNPGYAEAYSNLGIALQALGRHAEAVACYEKVLALKPGDAAAHNNLGTALHLLGEHEKAIEQHVRALAADPGRAGAYNNLGLALHALGRWSEAIAAFGKALSITPDSADAHNNLGNTLQALLRMDAAAASYRKALEIRPDYAEARNNLGNVLQVLGRPAEAIACYEAALALRPDRGDIHNNLGAALESIGQLAEARQAYERAIVLAPARPAFYRSLVDLAPVAPDDPRLPALEAMAQDPAALPESERIELDFALGKAMADIGQRERSFRHYLAGNALKRSRLVYDEAATLHQLDRIRAVFSAELMRAKQGLGDPSPVPVFILGMPRSGTTLVEQILASHPQVFGAGELMEFDDAVTRFGGPEGTAGAYPDFVPGMTGEELRRLGADYLDRVRAMAPAAERITDKMPANFRLVGLIHLALPNARIVHTRRDPVDTCLSCFTRLFAHHQPHTYDLRELARYYRAYAALMEHWRTVVPPGVMLEVEYEAVVADVETEARRILAHCSLPWDDACLAFHKTPRPVRTASASQVRQPIYRSAIGRWQPYREWLQPLLEELGL